MEFARRAGGQVVTGVVCNRFHPFNFGMIAPGNHLDLDSLRAAPPARYRSVALQIGICGGKTGHRTTLSFRTSPQTGVGIPIEFQAAHRHTGVLPCHFPNFIHEKWCFYPGDCHTSDICHWFAMTGSSIPHPSARQIPICKGVGEAFRLPQQAEKSPKRVGRNGK